jgi:hypothetical protein
MPVLVRGGDGVVRSALALPLAACGSPAAARVSNTSPVVIRGESSAGPPVPWRSRKVERSVIYLTFGLISSVTLAHTARRRSSAHSHSPAANGRRETKSLDRGLPPLRERTSLSSDSRGSGDLGSSVPASAAAEMLLRP